MSLNRNRFYLLLGSACLAGYTWLLFSMFNSGINQDEIGVCIIKHVTGIPCPSCGSTRSVISLVNGNILDSLYWNPIGLILALIMIVTPVWIIMDLISGKRSLFRFYGKIETVFRMKIIAIPAILLVMVNWIWNIYKGL